MPVLDYLWIIPLLPLLGAAANGIFGARWTKGVVTGVALSSTTLAFVAAIEAVREFLTVSADQDPCRPNRISRGFLLAGFVRISRCRWTNSA